MKRLALVLLLSSGCASPPAPVPPAPPTPPSTPAPVKPAPAPVDALGARPRTSPPSPYVPPVPRVLRLSSGLTVWLLERHALPLVSLTLVVPHGSSSDPRGKAGLAHMTANMLDEGAGPRNALELARHFESLGATLRTGAYADYSVVQLSLLRRNLAAALPAYVDVIARPTFSRPDFARVKDLWLGALKARRSEPVEVAKVAQLVLHYGEDHPYGHPVDGTSRSAEGIGLDEVRAFHRSAYGPERSTLVIVGDVTPAEIPDRIEKAFAPFAGTKSAALPEPTFPEPRARKRLVVVDRPDAPQSVVSLVLPSVSGSDPEAPLLSRVNIALGGSFTSRLNQDLREERGISYGASSRLSFSRKSGMFVAHASVQTDKTGEAVGALLGDVMEYAKTGPTEEEAEKTRLVARADVVEAYEGAAAAAGRLARLAGTGLSPDHDARWAVVRDAADRARLTEIARKWLDSREGLIVIVGPRAKVAPQLEKLGLGAIEAAQAE